MNKLAIFVEGYTEQEFLARLVIEIAGGGRVRIETRKASGGKNCKRRHKILNITPNDGQQYYVLIVNCACDSRVVSEIREQYDGLVNAGYTGIIGIRDVYPLGRHQIPEVETGMQYRIPTKPIRVLNVLSVMEVEAWFLAEHQHFLRIDKSLTLPRIVAHLRFDPSADDVEARDHPADDLHQLYQLAGLVYEKRAAVIQRTVEALDYDIVYLELPARVPRLAVLVDALSEFFSSVST